MLTVLRIATVTALGCLAAACGTPEYHQARQICFQEWSARIPPAYQQVFVNRERAVRVPNGKSTCTTNGNTTHCKEGTRTEWVPYTAVETIDVNEDERGLRVRQCASTRCLRSYGNPDCQT